MSEKKLKNHVLSFGDKPRDENKGVGKRDRNQSKFLFVPVASEEGGSAIFKGRG